MSSDAQIERRRPSGYVLLWALLAMAALAYLGMIAMRPDIMFRGGMARRLDPDALKALSRAADELQSLRKSAAETKGDIAEIRATVAGQGGRIGEIEKRLAAIEQRPGAVQASAAIVTGSVAAGAAAIDKEITFGQPKVVRAEPLALRLGTAASVEELRLRWALITDRHPAQVKDIEPRIVEANGSYTLVAGPIEAREVATKSCAQLKAKRMPCSVVRFAGDPLN